MSSSLYADCAHYTRLQWPTGPNEGACSGRCSLPDPLSSSSSSSSSCSSNEIGGPRWSWGAAGPPSSPSGAPRCSVTCDAEVVDCVLLPDVLLHPRAPESADVFYIAVASSSYGLMIVNVMLSEPEYTHEFAASLLLTRHLPGCFWRISATTAPLPEGLLLRQQQQQQQQKPLKSEGFLSLDSLSSIELKGEYLSRLEGTAREAKVEYAGNEMVLVACLSPRSRLLTLLSLIPNAVDYPGCDVHATVVELAPMGAPSGGVSGPLWASMKATALTWLGGERETGDRGLYGEGDDQESELMTEDALLNIQRDCCRRYRPLLCIGAPSSSVFVYELSFYSPPGASGGPHSTTTSSRAAAAAPAAAAAAAAAAAGQQQPKAQMLQFRLRLVYRLDGNRGHARLLTVPPCIVGGRRVLACSSGPHLLNLFEFKRVPNPDLFALPSDPAAPATAGGTAQEEETVPLNTKQQALVDAQQHAAASTAYIEYLKKAFSNAAAAPPPPPPPGIPLDEPAASCPDAAAAINMTIHHNKQLELQHLLQPSIRGVAAAAAPFPAPEGQQQDEELQRHIEQITNDLKACTLGNQQLQRMQQQQQQQQQGGEVDRRPPWNSRFSVKGSEYDHLFV